MFHLRAMPKIALLASMLLPTAAWASSYGTVEGCAFLANGKGAPFPVDSGDTSSPPAYFTGTTLAGTDWTCQLALMGGDRYHGNCKDEYGAYAAYGVEMTIAMVTDAVRLKFDGDMLPYTLKRCS